MLSYLHDFADEVELEIAIDVIPSPVLRVPDNNTVFVMARVMVIWLVGVEVYK